MTIRKSYLIQALKLALGALAAITLARALGLKYSTTAGTITMLSILDTKRETLRVALGRLMAYMAALVIAAVSYHLLGYTVAAFAVFLFFFAVVCCTRRWMFALSMMTVLMGHFMTEGGMSAEMLRNETLLFLIGASCGIAVNLTIRADESRMRELIAGVDGEMRQLLRLAADPQKQAEAQAKLAQLDGALLQARKLAASNRDNRLMHAPVFDLAYVEMRGQQRDILAQILTAAGKVHHRPVQQQTVEAFFQRVADEYHPGNDVTALQQGLNQLLDGMKEDALPTTRDEFESRAVLYYMLVRLRDFLSIKGDFYQAHMGAGKEG